MIAPEHESQAEVTREDQNEINRFARLLNERIETERTLKMRRDLVKLHEDAVEELVLVDDDEPVQHVVGDVFFFSPKSEVESSIEQQKEKLDAEVSKLSSELETIQSEMATIKSRLYAKFGKSINLDEDPE